MQTFTFRSGHEPNQASIQKSATSQPAYQIDFSDCLVGSDAISTGATTAVDQTNTTATTNCVRSTSVSGNKLIVYLATCGTSGTSPAVDGQRFRLTTTMTSTNGIVYPYNVYVFVIAKSYAPIPA